MYAIRSYYAIYKLYLLIVQLNIHLYVRIYNDMIHNMKLQNLDQVNKKVQVFVDANDAHELLFHHNIHIYNLFFLIPLL